MFQAEDGLKLGRDALPLRAMFRLDTEQAGDEGTDLACRLNQYIRDRFGRHALALALPIGFEAGEGFRRARVIVAVEYR